MDGFEVLADPLRRDLVRRLSAGPARVVDLAAGHAVTRPAVSRHLRLLTDAGVAVAEDRGRERHYRLVPDGLAPVRAFLDEVAGASRGTNRPLPDAVLDALDTEVRRSTRDRRRTTTPPDQQEEAG